MTTARRAGLTFVFLWFFLGGLGHFFATPFFAQIVPPWVPMAATTVVYLSGLAELAGALALLSVRLRPLAGIALLVLIVCVTPANVYMLQQAARFPEIPVLLLWLRLPMQALLMACVWWSTQPRPVQPSGNSPSR